MNKFQAVLTRRIEQTQTGRQAAKNRPVPSGAVTDAHASVLDSAPHAASRNPPAYRAAGTWGRTPILESFPNERMRS